MKNLLLVIDVQKDFVNPIGSLYVKGGETVVKNLIEWVRKNRGTTIDHIITTQDAHPTVHIGFSNYWNKDIKPFTVITSDNISEEKNGIIPRDQSKVYEVMNYLNCVNKVGNTPHTIWPVHCVRDTWGYFLPDELQRELYPYEAFYKGMNPDKEMYSAISYSDGSIPEKSLQLIERMKKEFDTIYIAGVAKDYCVAETVKDLIKFGLSSKLVFLNSCMAAIDDKSESLKIFDEAIKLGARYEN